MQKKYLVRKYRAGSDYIPELNGYVVDDPPNGEAYEEVDVYNVELKESAKSVALNDAFRKYRVHIGVGVLVLLSIGFILGRISK